MWAGVLATALPDPIPGPTSAYVLRMALKRSNGPFLRLSLINPRSVADPSKATGSPHRTLAERSLD